MVLSGSVPFAAVPEPDWDGVDAGIAALSSKYRLQSQCQSAIPYIFFSIASMIFRTSEDRTKV